MSIARKILSNTVAQLLGKVVVAILGLGVVKITTNYLSMEGYGEYVIVYEFLAYFGIAADLGLYTIAVREMSEDETKIPKIIGNILSLRTLLVTATMVLAIILAFNIEKYEDTRIPIGVAISSLTVFFTILNGTISSVLQTKLKMHITSATFVLSKAISLALMFYIAFYGFPNDKDAGFNMFMWAGVIGNLAMFLVTGYYVRKITPITYQFDLQLWKNVLKKSLPYGLALILSAIYFRINSLFIFFLKGQAEVSIYGVAMKMLEQLTVLPLYFMNSVLPVLTKAIKENTEKYKKIIQSAFDFLAALSIPLVVGGVVLAYPIIFIISNPKYLSRLSEGFYGSDIAMQILIFALLFQFLNVLFAFILIAINKQGKLLYINGIGVLFNIVANLLVIPYYGFRGAALSSVLSELYILCATYFIAKKYLEFNLSFKNTFKIIFSALIMGLVIYLLQPLTYKFMQNWNVMLLIPFGMVVYAAMLLITKTIDKETLQLFRKTKEDIPSIEI